MVALFSTFRVLAHENCCGINTTRYEKHCTWPTQKSNCGNFGEGAQSPIYLHGIWSVLQHHGQYHGIMR